MNIADVGLNKWAFRQMMFNGGNILDIGCGGGKTIYKLSQRYPEADIYGIDYSITAVKTTLKKNKQKVDRGEVKISQEDVSLIPYEGNFFDCILAIRTHYFWVNLRKASEEIFRVLNKGGQFLILYEIDKANFHMEKYNTKTELIRLLTDIGFESVDIYEKKHSICIIAKK